MSGTRLAPKRLPPPDGYGRRAPFRGANLPSSAKSTGDNAMKRLIPQVVAIKGGGTTFRRAAAGVAVALALLMLAARLSGAQQPAPPSAQQPAPAPAPAIEKRLAALEATVAAQGTRLTALQDALAKET